MNPFRVVYRQRARDAWQEREFATLIEAHRFKHQQRARLWAAAVQYWHTTEERWI